MAEPIGNTPPGPDRGKGIEQSFAHRDPQRSSYITLKDAVLRKTTGLGYIEFEQRRKEDHQTYDHFKNYAHARVIKVFDNEASDAMRAWRELPVEEKGDNFIEWYALRNDDFRLRYENFLRGISPITPSLAEAEEVFQREQEEAKRRAKALWVEPVTKPIEELSEVEIREEIVRRVTNALGKLLISPVADGGGTFGYNRSQDENLASNYFRFLKIMDELEQVRGVEIELLGLSNSHSRAFRQFDGRNLEESFDANRYYFIPVDPNLPGQVSTESFANRAKRVNPEAFSKGSFLLSSLFPEVGEALKTTDEKTTWTASMQDWRDALSVVRENDWFMREVIYETPPEYWGRPGLTE